MLLEFTSVASETHVLATYQPIPASKVLKGLAKLAQVFHRFATVMWVPETIEILKHRIQGVLDEDKLQAVIKRIRRIVDDNILIYIIQHIKKNPFEEISIEIFNQDVFEKYFSHIQDVTNLVDSKYQELHRKETIQRININLFGHLPDAQLTIYTRKHQALLGKQDIYEFKHAEPIESIVLFIDHVFQKMVIGNLQIPLLLKAIWNDTAAQQHLAQLFTDMKDLRIRISNIDQEIISMFGNEKLFHDMLTNVGFIKADQKTDLFSKFPIIDSRFAETIHIFRGISKLVVVQLQKLSQCRTNVSKRMIRNWAEMDQVCPNIEHKLLKAVSVFEDCIKLIDATYRHVSSITKTTSTQG